MVKRVAGQFAIREVIKQLEGDSQYVRDYWHMDEFYRAIRTSAEATIWNTRAGWRQLR